jgi:hypothetical protein
VRPPVRLGSSCLCTALGRHQEAHDGDRGNQPAEAGRSGATALEGAGYTRLEDLTKVTESEVMKLHGMGANAMQVLRSALAERGLSFRDG